MVQKETKEERREKWKQMSFCRKWLFASWKDFMFIATVLFLAWAYWHDHAVLLEVYEDPCAYCLECQAVPMIEGETGDVQWIREDGTPTQGNVSGSSGIRILELETLS